MSYVLHASPDTKAAPRNRTRPCSAWNFFPQPHSAQVPTKKIQPGDRPVPVGHQYGSNLMLSCMSNLKNRGVGFRKLRKPCNFQIQESAGRGDGTPQIISLDLCEMEPFVLGISEV